MKNLATEFRAAASSRPKGSPGRYPDSLRELALAHLAEVRSRGGRLSHAARELGVDANTLRSWDKRPRPTPPSDSKLLPVEIREPARERGAMYALVTSLGLRVECASAEAVARLLAVLS